MEGRPERDYLLHCSYIEIYNETLSDLLLHSTSRRTSQALALKEDERREVYVRGLSEVPTHSVEQAFGLVRRALRGEARVIVQIQVHAIQNRQTMRARGQ